MTDKQIVKRPFLLYLLVFIFLLAGMVSLVGTLGVLQSWNWWLSFISVQSIVLQVFSVVLTTLAWISAAVILWLRVSWAVIFSSVVTILIGVWFWVERLFLTQNPLPFSRHMLLLAIHCVFLIFVFSSLYLVVPAMESFRAPHINSGSTSVQTTGEKNE